MLFNEERKCPYLIYDSCPSSKGASKGYSANRFNGYRSGCYRCSLTNVALFDGNGDERNDSGGLVRVGKSTWVDRCGGWDSTFNYLDCYAYKGYLRKEKVKGFFKKIFK